MDSLVPLVCEPLRYPFMQMGLLALVLVGVVAALVGTFVVLRGLAFLGDALSHAMLPGVAIGYVLQGGARGPIFWWALGAAALTSLGVGALTRRSGVREDTAIGVVFAGMLALGVAIISSMRNYSTDLTHLLFGNVLAVGEGDLWRMLVLGGLVVLLLALFHKELVVLSFDPVLAETLRLPVRFLHYFLLFLVAVTIVLALQTVGIGLMMAFLVTPAATAMMITRRVGRMGAIAALIAVVSSVGGLYASYYLGIAPSAAVALVCTAIFAVTFLLTVRRRRSVGV